MAQWRTRLTSGCSVATELCCESKFEWTLVIPKALFFQGLENVMTHSLLGNLMRHRMRG